MLTIRLTRKGKKNQPFFKVVVIDNKRTASGGRAVEDLGYVNPLTKKRSFNKERILYWISKGAQPSATMHNYLISEKIIDEKKVKITNISKKKQAEIKAVEATAKIEAEKLVPVATPATSDVAVTPEVTPETSASVENSSETKPAV
jgi:small subunit ribosomal protein S16